MRIGEFQLRYCPLVILFCDDWALSRFEKLESALIMPYFGLASLSLNAGKSEFQATQQKRICDKSFVFLSALIDGLEGG
jgi:hypothetical protein